MAGSNGNSTEEDIENQEGEETTTYSNSSSSSTTNVSTKDDGSSDSDNDAQSTDDSDSQSGTSSEQGSNSAGGNESTSGESGSSASGTGEGNGVEEQAKKNQFIKKATRKALKKMAYLSQIAKIISLVPKPEDFATEVVGEMISMITSVSSLSTRINDTLETYTNLPADFLTNSTTNILESLSSTVSNVSDKANTMLSTVSNVTDKVDNLTNDSISGLDDIKSTVSDAKEKLNDTVDSINEWSNGVKDKVQNIVEKINNKMKEVNDTINSSFGDYKAFTSTSETLTQVSSDYSTDSSAAGQLIYATSEAMNNVIKNFNIGKLATGLIGMAENVVLVETGLKQLPELNMEKVVAFGKSTVKKIETNTLKNSVVAYEPSDEYKKVQKELEEKKKELRDKIRNNRKKPKSETQKRLTDEELKELHDNYASVASSIREKKKAALKAKIADKYRDMLINDIHTFTEEIKTYANNIRDDWNKMLQQYKEAVESIKEFFMGDDDTAYGAKEIDEICDEIENDCKHIKQCCTNIGSKVSYMVSKIPLPQVIGTSVDNPGYKVVDFFSDMKDVGSNVVLVVKFGIDIIKQVDKLAKIIINGLNSLDDIKKEILELLDIDWLIDFIDTIIDLFSEKCKEGKELIENTISPIYYGETDAYDNEMEALENLQDGNVGKNITIKNYNSKLDRKAKDRNKVRLEVDDETGTLNDDEDTENALEEAFDTLEDKGDNLVIGYKSPLLNDDGTEFKAWIYYHPNIDYYYGDGNNRKKRNARNLMKRAVKTSKRKKGGKNYLLSKEVKQLSRPITVDGDSQYKPKAYDAFYWYTKWTDDPTNDDIDTTSTEDVVSTVMTTENGTLVKLDDGRRVFVNSYGVKSGDYVLVEGKRYRVQ